LVGAGQAVDRAAAARPDRAAPLGPPLLLYGVLRVAQLLVIALVPGPRSVAERITVRDGGWYELIVRYGYPRSLPTGPAGVRGNPVAFFPGYPVAVRAVVAAGAPVWLGELLVSLAAGAVAVALVCVVAAEVTDPAASRRAALAWVLAPPTAVLGVGYAEGLFVAAAAGCLLLLLRRRWWLAGLAGAVATATRPTGAALVVAAAVAAVPAVARAVRRDRDGWAGWPGWPGWAAVAPLAAVLLVPVGGLGYLAWLWAHTGRADAWFATERQGWDTHFDAGLAMAKVAREVVLHPVRRPLFDMVAVTALVCGALLVLAVRDRLPPPLLAYSAVILLLGAGSGVGTVGSFPRVAVTAFPLCIPLGTRLGRWPRWLRLLLAAAALAGLLATVVIAARSPTAPPSPY
jgi:hypothetical protein